MPTRGMGDIAQIEPEHAIVPILKCPISRENYFFKPPFLPFHLEIRDSNVLAHQVVVRTKHVNTQKALSSVWHISDINCNRY